MSSAPAGVATKRWQKVSSPPAYSVSVLLIVPLSTSGASAP